MRLRIGFFMAAVVGAAVLGTPASAMSVLVNGDFESGDFTGWSVSPSPPGNSVLIVDPSSFSPFNNRVHDGNYGVNFGANDTALGVISQTFSTIAGATYDASLWYGAIACCSFGQSLKVEVLSILSGLPIYSTFLNQSGNPVGTPVPQWQYHAFSFVADGTQATIRFSDTSAVTNSADGLLDTVSVEGPSPVPIPAAFPLLAGALGATALVARWKRRGRRPDAAGAA